MMCFHIDIPGGVEVIVEGPGSLRVSWNPLTGADSYTVTVSQLMGENQTGPCHQLSSHTLIVNTSSLSIVVGDSDEEQLKAYTTYSVTVAALTGIWGSTSKPSQPVNVTTGQKGRVICFALTYKMSEHLQALKCVQHLVV